MFEMQQLDKAGALTTLCAAASTLHLPFFQLIHCLVTTMCCEVQVLSAPGGASNLLRFKDRMRDAQQAQHALRWHKPVPELLMGTPGAPELNKTACDFFIPPFKP